MKWILLFTVALSACTTKVVSEPTFEQLEKRPTVIVIHGYYGSTLRDTRSKKRSYLNPFDLLFGPLPLALEAEKLGTPTAPPLEAEGILSSLDIIPFFYREEVYSDLFKSFPTNVQVVPLAYDWRQDPVLAVEKLNKIINKINDPDISVVAHSMGGLVLAYYLGYGPQPLKTAKLNWEGGKKIKKAVFFGTPFLGAMSMFRDLEEGAPLSKYRLFLTADTIGSFPSAYRLLPTEEVQFYTTTKQNMNASFYDLNFWEAHHAGLLKRQDLPWATIDSRKKYLAEQLNNAQKFSQLLKFSGEKLPSLKLRILNIIGHKQKTLDAAAFDSAGQRFTFEASENFQDGDKTVSTKSATIPASLKSITNELFTDFPHTKLFSDPAIKTAYLNFLQ